MCVETPEIHKNLILIQELGFGKLSKHLGSENILKAFQCPAFKIPCFAKKAR